MEDCLFTILKSLHKPFTVDVNQDFVCNIAAL